MWCLPRLPPNRQTSAFSTFIILLGTGLSFGSDQSGAALVDKVLALNTDSNKLDSSASSTQVSTSFSSLSRFSLYEFIAASLSSSCFSNFFSFSIFLLLPLLALLRNLFTVHASAFSTSLDLNTALLTNIFSLYLFLIHASFSALSVSGPGFSRPLTFLSSILLTMLFPNSAITFNISGSQTSSLIALTLEM